VIIQGEQGTLELTVRDGEDLVYPGAPVTASMTCGAFCGASDRAWLASDDFDRFLSSLEALEQSRQGEAVLESMSPGELSVRIHAVARAGHLAMEVVIGEQRVGEHSWHERLVKCSFPLDPGQLPQIVRQFTAFRTALPAG
jgi:hypothetical protein